MPFHVCYYHVVWTTKNRIPWSISGMERHLVEAIEQKSQGLKSHVECINAWMNHVHVAVQIRPTLAISEWVRQVKGYSSFHINQLYPNAVELFRWQESYGVMTFGTKQLPFITTYIKNQQQHHEMQTTSTYLENTGQDSEKSIDSSDG